MAIWSGAVSGAHLLLLLLDFELLLLVQQLLLAQLLLNQLLVLD